MTRTLSGVVLIGLAVLAVYLWTRGSFNSALDFVTKSAQGQRPKPRLLGGQEAAGA